MSWVSPYKHEDIVVLTDRAIPLRTPRALQRISWSLGSWATKRIEAYIEAAPIPVPVNELKKALANWRTTYLANDIARSMLRASVNGDAVDLSLPALTQRCNDLFGDAEAFSDLNLSYAALIVLVNSALDDAASREPELSRIVEVRKTDLRRVAAEITTPTAITAHWVALMENINAIHYGFQRSLSEIRDRLVVANGLRYVEVTRYDECLTWRIEDELSEIASKSLDELCLWVYNQLVPLDVREHARVTANFMVFDEGVQARVVDAVGYKEATTMWGRHPYVESADGRLIVVWSTIRDLRGFWLPVVRSMPIGLVPK